MPLIPGIAGRRGGECWRRSIVLAEFGHASDSHRIVVIEGRQVQASAFAIVDRHHFQIVAVVAICIRVTVGECAHLALPPAIVRMAHNSLVDVRVFNCKKKYKKC